MPYTSRQTKRHREIEDTLWRVQEQRDLAITRLIRIEGRLRSLLKSKARLEKAMVKSTVPVSVAAGELLPEPEPPAAVILDDDIPDFLDRRKQAAQKDAAAAAEIKQQQAETKRTKSQVRIEKMKAKASGETKKMPLTGKEAMRFIAQG